MVKTLRLVLASPFLLLLFLYRYLVSPVIHTLFPGSGCRFEPTCSRYAIEAFKTLPLHHAIRLTVWRVLRCNPWTKGGYDPVPPSHMVSFRSLKR